MDSTAYDLVQIEIEIATTTGILHRGPQFQRQAIYYLTAVQYLSVFTLSCSTLLVEHCTEIIYFLHQICLNIYILE